MFFDCLVISFEHLCVKKLDKKDNIFQHFQKKSVNLMQLFQIKAFGKNINDTVLSIN